MKTLLSILLTLMVSISLTAQNDYREGYIVTDTDETKLVEILVVGKVKTRKSGQVKKYTKRSLKDYGYIVNGKKQSIYAATAFPVSTYDGYYVSTQGDTIRIYISRWSNEVLVGYRKIDRVRTKLYPTMLKGFAVKRHKDYTWYEKVRYEVRVGLLDIRYNEEQFIEAKLQGDINYYNTILTIQSAPTMGPNGMMTGGSSSQVPVYVFQKGDKIFAVEARALRSIDKFRRDLLPVFEDASELQARIKSRDFKKSDVYELVRAYNNGER